MKDTKLQNVFKPFFKDLKVFYLGSVVFLSLLSLSLSSENFSPMMGKTSISVFFFFNYCCISV